MRVAAIYDIHGNLPALEAALDDIRRAGVDRVVVGGDVVPGPMPSETIATLMDIEMPVQFIRGSGETEVLSVLAGAGPGPAVPEQFHEALRWVAEELLAEQIRVLAGWPRTHPLEIPGLGNVLFCHATPRSDTEIFTEVTPEERLRNPGAYRLLLAPGVELRHSSYDLAAAAGRIRATSYPRAADFAETYVLSRPTRAEMLGSFESAAIR